MEATVELLYHVFVGFPLCVVFVTAGLLMCCTIIGIPLGIALIASGVKML